MNKLKPLMSSATEGKRVIVFLLVSNRSFVCPDNKISHEPNWIDFKEMLRNELLDVHLQLITFLESTSGRAGGGGWGGVYHLWNLIGSTHVDWQVTSGVINRCSCD